MKYTIINTQMLLFGAGRPAEHRIGVSMYGYIYKTTNLINNKTYVGQHKSNKLELSVYKGSGIILLEAFKKYGFDNFICELIESCESKEVLNEREKYWINELKPDYNVSEGGNGGDLGSSVNNKISETIKNHWKTGVVKHHPNSGFKKGCTPWNKGKPGTFKGKHHSEESKLKISLASKSRTISEQQRKQHSERMKGHTVSEETRRKMSEHNCMKNPEYREKARINRLKNIHIKNI